MPPRPPDAPPPLPAFVLALALLGAFVAIGGQVWVQMRMAPGTLLPAPQGVFPRYVDPEAEAAKQAQSQPKPGKEKKPKPPKE